MSTRPPISVEGSTPIPEAQPPSGSGRNLTARTLAGLRWSYLAAGSNAVIQMVYVAIMSRLLSPRDFGLMAIGTLAVNFGFYFSRMGMGQALIQKSEVTEDDVRAATTSGMVLGLVCFTAMWFVAPALASFFDAPAATPLLRAMGATFLINGLAITGQGLLRRELRFREISVITVTTSLMMLAVGVAMAVAGFGVWSLVGATLVNTGATWVLQYTRTRHSLKPILAGRSFRDLYSYGVRSSGLRLLEFLGKNLDTFAVGRFASTAALGQYNRAFHLVNLPLSRYLSTSLTSVLFPSFSKVQSSPERLRRAYLSALGVAAVVLLPTAAGMAIAAREIVFVILGDQWGTAVALVPFFALAAALNILSKITELLCEARAELNRTLGLQGAYLLVLAALLFIARDGEVWAFAAALMVGEILRHAAFLVMLRRLFGWGGRRHRARLCARAVRCCGRGGRRLLWS